LQKEKKKITTDEQILEDINSLEVQKLFFVYLD